jgi:hypothetical protein
VVFPPVGGVAIEVIVVDRLDVERLPGDVAGVDPCTFVAIRGLTAILYPRDPQSGGWSGAGVVALITAAITLAQNAAALYVQNFPSIKGGGP